MTPVQSTDLDQARRCFDHSRNRVIEVTTGLSDAQSRFKPTPDRWSIAEILEHMVTVQERVLGPVRQLLAQAPAPPNRDAREIDLILIEKIPDRSMRANAPEPIVPTGKVPCAVALERLSTNYERLLEFIDATPDLRDHAVEAPPLRFVTNGAHTMMDGYQWALTVALHDERHVRQIIEVKSHPDYPPST